MIILLPLSFVFFFPLYLPFYCITISSSLPSPSWPFIFLFFPSLLLPSHFLIYLPFLSFFHSFFILFLFSSFSFLFDLAELYCLCKISHRFSAFHLKSFSPINLWPPFQSVTFSNKLLPSTNQIPYYVHQSLDSRFRVVNTFLNS